MEKKKKKKWPIVVGIIVVIIVIGSIAGGSSDAKKVGDSTGTGAASNNQESQQSTFQVGDVVELNGVQVTLVGVTESAGQQYMMPADGNTFLICEFEINNQSASEITVSSVMSFDAYCDDYAISQSFTALAMVEDKQQLDGTVAAGKKMNGVIGYEVAQDWKKVEITYSPSYWGNKSMTFEATK